MKKKLNYQNGAKSSSSSSTEKRQRTTSISGETPDVAEEAQRLEGQDTAIAGGMAHVEKSWIAAVDAPPGGSIFLSQVNCKNIHQMKQQFQAI